MTNATATGTTATITRGREPYHHFRDNVVLADRFATHLAAEGVVLTEPTPGVYLGSSDIGNVSTVTPAMHPFVAIVDADQTDHTPEFAAADALAGTAVDLLTDPVFRHAVRENHDRSAGRTATVIGT